MYLNPAKDHLKILLKDKTPVFLWGAPGLGKSSIIAQICQEWDWELIDLRLSLLSPVDLRGLPYLDHEKKCAVWLKPEFLPNGGHKKQGILFLDELNTAPTSVQIAAYQLVLDRRIGNYVFPEDWRIVAAGNRECVTSATWVKVVRNPNHGGNWRNGWKTVSGLKVGDKIISYNLERNIFEEDEVLKKIKRNKPLTEKLYQIRTDKGNCFEATGNHPLLTKTGYVRMDELSIGDVILEYPETPDKYRLGINYAKLEKLNCLGCGRVFYSKHNLKACGLSCAAKLNKSTRKSGWKHTINAKEKIRKCSKVMWQKKREKLISAMLNAHKPPGFSEKMSVALKNSTRHQERMKHYYPHALMSWRKTNPKEFIISAQRGAINLRKNLADHGQRTQPEILMEKLLRVAGAKFTPEVPIFDQNNRLITIVDFLNKSKKIAIFVDGEYWHNYPNGTNKDGLITQKLHSLGYKVLRFWAKSLELEPDQVRFQIMTCYLNGAVVTSIREIKERCSVYDITTHNHNFIANGLIVHNSDGASVTKMPSPLANRLIHLDVEANIDDWKLWARGKVRQEVISFLDFRPNLLSVVPKSDERAFPSPRSWAFASNILNLYPNPDACEEILKGTIGDGATKEFMHFLNVYAKLPPIDKILEGKYTTPPDPKKPDVIYALVGALITKLSDTNLTHYLDYVRKIQPADFFALAIREAAKSGWEDKIRNHPSWKNLAQEIRPYL